MERRRPTQAYSIVKVAGVHEVPGASINYLLDCARSGQGRQEAADFVKEAYLALLEHGSLVRSASKEPIAAQRLQWP
jgi:hypothetical protein